MKAMIIATCAFFLLIFSVQAVEIIELDTSDKTSPNIPLKYQPGTTEWDGAGVKIAANVTNDSEATYDTVRVVFTFKNAQGNMLIATHTVNVQPQKIVPGQSGSLEQWIECHGTQPAQVDVQVTAVKLME